MKLTVRIFIQKHENRTYTVTVPVLPGLSAYGPTLEECKEEVAQALAKRLSEMPAEYLQHVGLGPNQALEKVTVELRPTDQQGKRRRDAVKLTVSFILTPEEDGQILVSAPRLNDPPLSFFIARHAELNDVAQLELAQYFHHASFEQLLFYRAARYETLDTLEVEFKPKTAVERVEEEEKENFWALRQCGINLTAQAGEGQLRRAYRRDKEVEEVLATIASERRPSLLLIGPPGAGKTALIHEVARRIRRKECSEVLHDRQVWSVTGQTLIAGMTFIGQWQEKLSNVVQEVRKKRHILFVEDVASLADAGRWARGDENMADFLKPHVQSGDVILIGESTPERLRYTDRLTPSFVAQFRTLEIAPTGEADTLSILTHVARELERSEEVRLAPSALEAAVELTNRFLPYRAQPGKAIVLLEQTVGDFVRQHKPTAPGAAEQRPLTRRDVVATFTRQTGLPEFIVADDVPLDLAAVRTHFAERVIGQEAAVDTMTDLIATVKAGLSDPEKPLGTFFFIGPTGVGKTQLAKTLAGYLFGDERRVTRFDMSEYSDPIGVRRLIGFPGSGAEGELTRRVRAQPFCVLLLDEFEKADPQIYDLLLQVLGEGHLTDASGQTTSFQNAIILLTSNLGGSAREQRSLGLPTGSQAATGRDPHFWERKVKDYFRPEFVNRLDQIVVFNPLSPETMRQIARRELGEVLLRQGLVRRNLLVEMDEQVLDLLMEQGFDSTYGARPLKRAMERLVVRPLAHFLAGGRVDSDLLRLRRQGDQVVLSSVKFTEEERTSEVLLGEGLLSSGRQIRRLDDQGLIAAFAELRRKLQDWAERDAVKEMHNERAFRLAETNRPTFWDNGDNARFTLARFYFLDRLLKRLQQLTDRAAYLEELAGMVYHQRDAHYRQELAESYQQLDRDYAFLEVELLCAHLTHNHRAVLHLRRVGQAAKGDEAGPWLSQLAAMYLRWAQRKGYESAVATLEPLGEAERQGDWRYYPYKWRWLDVSDFDALLKSLAERAASNELAISLEGTNVYGFLKGESGIHRRSDKRPSGERIQTLVEVVVEGPEEQDGRAWLEEQLLQRAQEEQKRAQMSKKDLAALPAPSTPEVARVYQFEGERGVRDLRTRLRRSNVDAIIEGDVDDFILAYLRDTEAQTAWAEEEVER
jgi:ATP-dependent Clp protease ATP-binding subunit ClpC